MKDIVKKRIDRKADDCYPKYEDGRYTLFMGIQDTMLHRHTSGSKDLLVSHVRGYSTSIGPLNLEDLKALRKLVRKAIKNYESTEEFQI